MMIFRLNEVTSLMLGETLRVRFAEVDCSAFKTVFSLSHEMLICPKAFIGFHDAVDMLNVMGTFPVFLT